MTPFFGRTGGFFDRESDLLLLVILLLMNENADWRLILALVYILM